MNGYLLERDGCFLKFDGVHLLIGNELFYRELDLSRGVPRTVALHLADGTDFASSGHVLEDVHFIGINGSDFPGIEYELKSVSAEWKSDLHFDSPHLEGCIVSQDPVQQVVFKRFFAVYPGIPVLSCWSSIQSSVMPNVYWSSRLPNTESKTDLHRRESSVDGFRMADDVSVRLTVKFRAKTDENDDLVFENRIPSDRMIGNLLFAENQDDSGFFILQETSPSEERRDLESYDFRLDGQELFSCCWGVHPSELEPGREFVSCRNTIGFYSRQESGNRILKQYLRIRFPFDARHLSVTVNPWGCGRFPKLVSEKFLKDEITASAESGATHYQIDDSWQEGGSLQEMMSKNRALMPEFWDVSKERLNGSFDSLVSHAGNVGIEPSLWVAPSSNMEYRDWRSFCDMLLKYHRTAGFRIFKIDGVRIRTSEAERNLETLLRTAREESGYEISFNLDTTAGQRPGYFRMLEYGNIFLENRYVCHLWGCGYHPEKTLRSLWMLSKYMRSQMLQIEIPYYGDINRSFYETKAEGAPDRYPWRYWMAVALFASPLLWYAPSLTSASDRAEMREMMELHKSLRNEIFSGDVEPVGEMPSGSAITGFYADCGYLLVFREKNSESDSARLNVPSGTWMRISGVGEILSQSENVVTVSLPETASFALFQRQ